MPFAGLHPSQVCIAPLGRDLLEGFSYAAISFQFSLAPEKLQIPATA
jgi:hypothetical protein